MIVVSFPQVELIKCEVVRGKNSSTPLVGLIRTQISVVRHPDSDGLEDRL